MDEVGSVFWVWYKPPNLPTGLSLQIPEVTFQQYANQPAISLRNLIIRAGLNPQEIHSWHLYGNTYDAAQGTSPLLDHPVPPPVAGMDPNVLVSMLVETQEPSTVVPQPAAAMPATMSANAAKNLQPEYLEEMFRRMENDWHKSMEIDRQLSNQRKKMVGMMSKLQSLNRDLTLEESLAATSQDKVEWQTTRSWLRNSATKLSKLIKAFDIGATSSAGQRLWFAEVYEKNIEPRIPFEGMEQTQRDIETYRKMMQTLAVRVGSAQSDAAADGERRANSVLNKIAGRVRKERVKKRSEKR